MVGIDLIKAKASLKRRWSSSERTESAARGTVIVPGESHLMCQESSASRNGDFSMSFELAVEASTLHW